MTLDWDYEKRQVHVSMPGYVEKSLKQFGHVWNGKKQDVGTFTTTFSLRAIFTWNFIEAFSTDLGTTHFFPKGIRGISDLAK